MSAPLLAEYLAYSQDSLEELAWAIETSAGQFSLMLARCNYLHLQEHLVEQLQRSLVGIHTLTLKPDETKLYTRIQTELNGAKSAALMVFGFESITHLDLLFSIANQVREEFQKSFPFPIVLWLNNEGYKHMVGTAPDFESWASTTSFILPPAGLTKMLQQAMDCLFDTLLDQGSVQTFEERFKSLQLPFLQLAEVTMVLQELRYQKHVLEPALQADINFLCGFTAHGLQQALDTFRKSLDFWQANATPSDQMAQLKMGLLLFYISQTEFNLIEQERQQTPDWQILKSSLQQAIHSFEQAQRPDLTTQCLILKQRVLQKLQAWQELEVVSQQALEQHQAQGNLLLVVQDYGFQARSALEQKQPAMAYKAAQSALQILESLPETHSRLKSLHLLFLAQAEQQMGQPSEAIKHLEQARSLGDQGQPSTYIQILKTLQALYFDGGNYREAFRIKRDWLSVEQQYGIRAFVGAGRILPRREISSPERIDQQTQDSSSLDQIAPEIAAAGRQQDLEKLLARLGRNDSRLIVIHGNSGVGKSSLVNAGLVPALQLNAIGTRRSLPVVMQIYTNWVEELSRLLAQAQNQRPDTQLQTPEILLEKLQHIDKQDLQAVLIFDQFEEFFFVYQKPEERRIFFKFLADCFQILSLNVVLSLREDYLHLLLECSRLPEMEITGIDILSRNVLYGLGNFSKPDAKGIIESLTARARFYLEPELVDALVSDLSEELGEVRPIELQIVGSQLQAMQITAFNSYRNLGSKPKETLVGKYLAEIINDCGSQLSKLAKLLLYLLTDEKGIRPLKTRTELEKELWPLMPDGRPNDAQLELVLEILVDSGLVLQLPEVPMDRYQIVHDYLATFIRKQQEPQKLGILKEEFLYAVSHELRTPLANMKLAIHMMESGTTPEKQQRYLQILKSECLRETSLVNDLLDFQHLEADRLPISPEPIELDTLIPRILAPFFSRADQRQLNLITDIQTTVKLSSDRQCLERILCELVNNACKYTPPGGSIIVGVQQHNGIEISVWNNGSEIPEEEIPRIFEMFYRIPGSDHWFQGGIGLGLSLVKKLVTRIGGNIQVESRANETSFIVKLPLDITVGDRESYSR